MENSAISYRVLFNRQTERLVQALRDHTRLPTSAVLIPCAGNSSYMKQSGLNGTHGVSVGKHDTFLENISAIWPKDCPWPSDIPRPDPMKATYSQLSKEARETFAARVLREKEKSEKKGSGS